MKLIKNPKIIKFVRSNLFKLLLLDLVLILLYRYYEPLYEPCLEGMDCSKPLPPEQCFIIIFGVVVNTFYIILSIYRKVKW